MKKRKDLPPEDAGDFQDFEDWDEEAKKAAEEEGENIPGEEGDLQEFDEEFLEEDVEPERDEGEYAAEEEGEFYEEEPIDQPPEELAEEPLEEEQETSKAKKPLKSSKEKAQPKSQMPEKFDKAALDLAPDVPVQVIAVVGKRGITIKELMEMRMGQVIDLRRPPNETVDVVVNGKLFARGELVEIDGKMGVKILKLVK